MPDVKRRFVGTGRKKIFFSVLAIIYESVVLDSRVYVIKDSFRLYLAKVIYAEGVKPLSLKVRFLIIETLPSNVSSHLDPGLMYQGLPSIPLLRQLRYIMLYADFSILRLNNFSGLIWSLYTLHGLYFMDG